jgi:twinkle protein
MMKDANAYLEAGKVQDFNRLVFGAGKIVPDGVIASFDEVAEALKGQGREILCAYPFSGLQSKLEGLAPSESVLVSGREGIGKTEIFRKLQHTILSSTEHNVGVVHLEEPKKDTVNNLLTYQLNVPLRRQGRDVALDIKMQAYKDLVRREDRLFIYNHYGSDSVDAILGIVRYLVVACGCKFIFLDHINIIVSGMLDADERKTLDYLSTKLNTLVTELDFCLIAICHINDSGETRGSRNMGQVFHTHIRLEREVASEDALVRRRLMFNVYKNRPVGPTGPAGFGVFNEQTGTLDDTDTTFGIPDPESEGESE